MPFEQSNSYTALSTASLSNVDVQVSNGLLEDANGNSLYFGTQPPTFDVRGFEDRYVDRVKNSSPSGNLSVQNGQPYVDGHGAVTLTDPTGRREVTSVGGANGNNGDFKINSNNELYIEYTESNTEIYYTENSASATIDNVGDAFVSGELNAPSIPDNGDFRSIILRTKVEDGSTETDDATGVLVIDPSWKSEQSSSFEFDEGQDAWVDIDYQTFTDYRSQTAEGRVGFDTMSGANKCTFSYTVSYTETTTTTQTTTISIY